MDRRRDYMRRREDRRRGRNPYGSSGGYVSNRRGRDSQMDSRDYGPEHNRGGLGRGDYRSYDSRGDYHYERPREYSRPMEYEVYGVGGMRPREDYMNDRRDYRSDYRGDYNSDYRRDYRSDYNSDYDYRGGDYSNSDIDKEYEQDLNEWSEKLKKKDNRFKIPKEQIIRQAENMGIKFDKYNENELYATYLMVLSVYPTVSNEYNMYIKMAKDWLEEPDIAVSPSEKLCKHLYSIVKGEE